MKKTHKEQLIQIFKEAGVTADQDFYGKNSLRLGVGNPGVDGYAGFETIFTFDADGKLLAVGIYE